MDFYTVNVTYSTKKDDGDKEELPKEEQVIDKLSCSQEMGDDDEHGEAPPLTQTNCSLGAGMVTQDEAPEKK